MKKFEYKNGTVYVYGELNKERLRKSTIRFIKKVYKYKAIKENNCNERNKTRTFKEK